VLAKEVGDIGFVIHDQDACGTRRLPQGQPHAHDAASRTLGKMEAFAIAKRHRIPLAPVRDVDEVMQDRHMHERGMLEWIEHDEIGRIVVPTTPLRIHGADRVEAVPSPKLGQHNRDIYGDWLGLSAAEIAALERDGVI
jgi:CoA:oxalate CoA-transferase